MKRYLIASLLLGTSLFAADNAKIIGFFKANVPSDVKIEVVESKKLKELPKFELVTIKMTKDNKSQNMKMFYTDGVLIPEMFSLKTKKPMMQDIEKKATMAALKKIYKKESKKNIIKLGNDSKKETIVIFTDPECPFCRKELSTIEERLEKNNIKLIFTSVHALSAFQKTALIYKNVKKAKTDKEKIAIFRKYFDPKVDISKEKIDDKEVQKMIALKDKYMKSGALRGVPAIFREKDIK